DDWSKRPLQVMLDTLGFSPGALDGKIGAKTQAATKEFQKTQGLPATGNANPSTREKLYSAYVDKTCQDPVWQPLQVDKPRMREGGQGHCRQAALPGRKQVHAAPDVPAVGKPPAQEAQPEAARQLRDRAKPPRQRLSVPARNAHRPRGLAVPAGQGGLRRLQE